VKAEQLRSSVLVILSRQRRSDQRIYRIVEFDIVEDFSRPLAVDELPPFVEAAKCLG
jgi:hypothetical protein